MTDSSPQYDILYLRRQSWLTRLVFRLFARRIKQMAKYAVGQAWKRSLISSQGMHDIDGTLDRMLFSKPEQKAAALHKMRTDP